MPAESIPFVAAVCAAFSFFVVVVGGVSVWVNLPARRSAVDDGGS